jgi:hypothetical protein
LFHNSNLFGPCIIHILYTECAKIKKNNSGAKRLKYVVIEPVRSCACILSIPYWCVCVCVCVQRTVQS